VGQITNEVGDGDCSVLRPHTRGSFELSTVCNYFRLDGNHTYGALDHDRY
jgi:hypothetical protein